MLPAGHRLEASPVPWLQPGHQVVDIDAAPLKGRADVARVIHLAPVAQETRSRPSSPGVQTG